MKGSILILLGCLTSFFVACSSNSTKSILEERAGYGTPPLGTIGASGGVGYIPTRIPEKVIVAWLHAHELPSKDYFWGSWLSIVVAPEGWEMTKVDVPKNAKRTEERPITKPIKRTKLLVKPAA